MKIEPNPEGVTGIKTTQTSTFHYILLQISLRIPGIPLWTFSFYDASPGWEYNYIHFVYVNANKKIYNNHPAIKTFLLLICDHSQNLRNCFSYLWPNQKCSLQVLTQQRNGYDCACPFTIIDLCPFPLMIPTIYLRNSVFRLLLIRFSLPFTAKTTWI